MGDTWEPANVTVEGEGARCKPYRKEEDERDRAQIVAAVVLVSTTMTTTISGMTLPAIPAAHKEQGAVVSGRRMDKNEMTKRANEKQLCVPSRPLSRLRGSKMRCVG